MHFAPERAALAQRIANPPHRGTEALGGGRGAVIVGVRGRGRATQAERPEKEALATRQRVAAMQGVTLKRRGRFEAGGQLEARMASLMGWMRGSSRRVRDGDGAAHGCPPSCGCQPAAKSARRRLLSGRAPHERHDLTGVLRIASHIRCSGDLPAWAGSWPGRVRRLSRLCAGGGPAGRRHWLSR